MTTQPRVMSMDGSKPAERLQEGGTDWVRLDRMSDDDIRRAVDGDPDAAPIMSPEDFKRAKLVPPRNRQ